MAPGASARTEAGRAPRHRRLFGLQPLIDARLQRQSQPPRPANAAGCGHFLSEDLNDGQVYGSVRVINPFRHAPDDVLGPALSS